MQRRERQPPAATTTLEARTVTLKVGDRVPDVTGKLASGAAWTTRDSLGAPLVIYFYPKDFTPGCTREACAFRDAREELLGRYGAQVVGVSRDTPSSHQQFAEKHSLPFPLVADTTGEIASAFGTAYFGFLPITRRVTFVIDADGIIRGVFDHQSAAERHVDEVRECLEGFVGKPA
jgi:peroxiredoxin Q/BCP